MIGTATHDVVVVGGGTAGLSAALVLGRSRRRVLVLDGGEPRNALSSGVKGFLTRDGVPPLEMLEIARGQLEPYGGVELRSARAADAGRTSGGFRVALEDGSGVVARKLVLATGVADGPPERRGFRELWGRGVYNCPYCHGWEVRDRPLAVLNPTEHAAGQVALVRNWSRDLVLLTDGPAGLGEDDRRKLRALGVPVREERISHLEGDPEGEELRRVVFEDGASLERAGVFHVPPQRQRSPLAESLGCGIEPLGPRGTVVKNDPTTKETTVPGVYVVGDSGAPPSPLQSAILAAASGAQAAYFLNHALAAEDAAAEIRDAPGDPDAPSEGLR